MMRRILYLCDRCGDVIHENPLTLTVEALDRANNCETVAEVVSDYEKHFCKKCKKSRFLEKIIFFEK